MSYSPKHDSSADRAVKKASPDAKKKQNIGLIALVAVLAVVVIVVVALLVRPDNSVKSSPLYPDGVLPTSGNRHDVQLAPNGGKDAMEVNGLWRLDKVTLYEFDGYGRGILHTGVDDYSFAYSAENGFVEIDFDTDNGRDSEYSYVLDGDTMTFTRGDSSYTLTKEIDA